MNRSTLASIAIGFGVIASVVVAWHVYVEWKDISPFVLPPPSDVGGATVDLLADGATWHHVRVTTVEIVAGFALAVVAGVVVGTILGEVPMLGRALTPLVVALQVLPKVAVIPLLLLWLGFGISAKVVIAAVFGFFPVVAATQTGIRSVEPGHRDVATTLRANRGQRVLLVDLPSALPSILTGMEVGMVLATVGTVVAEYLAGGEGLGWLAVTYLNQLRIDALFAVIVVLCALGLLLYVGVAMLRRLDVPWHQSATTGVPGL